MSALRVCYRKQTGSFPPKFGRTYRTSMDRRQALLEERSSRRAVLASLPKHQLDV
jgi:hypothetical protein